MMKNYTIEDAAHLDGYVEGLLSTKFYYALLLSPQISEKLAAKVLNWPQAVLSDILSDDTEVVRTVWLGDRTVIITQHRQRYINAFHDLCRRYGLYPKPATKLEVSFIDALTLCTLYNIPETDFSIHNTHDAKYVCGEDVIWSSLRKEMYEKYSIDPKNCSSLEHDFVQAATMEKAQNVTFSFQYIEPEDK